MQEQDQHEDYFTSSGRRKRTAWIVVAHLLVVGAFFAATFYWGNFS
ncbi:MAG TPA: hypothetical protein VMZ32_16435 [Gammaproteobacteria bacterium]|nr:hypothetical protein [Gammaproteobacteria bacterium]